MMHCNFELVEQLINCVTENLFELFFFFFLGSPVKMTTGLFS